MERRLFAARRFAVYRDAWVAPDCLWHDCATKQCLSYFSIMSGRISVTRSLSSRIPSWRDEQFGSSSSQWHEWVRIESAAWSFAEAAPRCSARGPLGEAPVQFCVPVASHCCLYQRPGWGRLFLTWPPMCRQSSPVCFVTYEQAEIRRLGKQW
jgi:hypothetical protein